MNVAWLKSLTKVAPSVLMFTPLAPFASIISTSIATAEQLGKLNNLTGQQKKVLAEELSKRAGEVVNMLKGESIIDVNELTLTVSSGIDTVVHATNVVHKQTE